MRDLVDPVQDEQLASFVVDSHIRSHPDPDNEIVDILNAESTKNKNNQQVSFINIQFSSIIHNY